MNTTLSQVVVHLDQSVDEATLSELEQRIRHGEGIVSVARLPKQRHLMVVAYDSTVARAASILQAFHEGGLHAQVIGM